jgi:hypothetical protein
LASKRSLSDDLLAENGKGSARRAPFANMAPVIVSPTTTASRTRVERLAAWYFGGHALLDLVWWGTVASSDRFRGWFDLDPGQGRALDAFFFPDMVILFVASAIAAGAILRRWRSANVLAALVTGGSTYATLYLAGWVIRGGHGWLGVVAMSVETTIMIVFLRLLMKERT